MEIHQVGAKLIHWVDGHNVMKLIHALHVYAYLIQRHIYISVHGYAIFRHVSNLNVLYWQLPRGQHESAMSYSHVDGGCAGRM